jgi:ribosomal protein S18 acetylase RimI-like enzyme
MKITGMETRRAGPADAGAIAEAHYDSISSIGPSFYPADVVDRWREGLTAELYTAAMEQGEVFFIAVGEIDGTRTVLGFASDYPLDEHEHGTSVYVRGVAARQGIGSALLRLAEAHALANNAMSITVEASLAGVEFYRANGFVDIGRGETYLKSGAPIACVRMRKTLTLPGA